jgi:uncharacterized protein YabE (DUF348 family)/3D (Asp-Asp-Asp) domain-containing protein
LAYWLERAPAWPRVRQRSERLQNVFLGLIETARARLHLALMVTIFFAGVVGFVVQPPVHLTISADGQTVTVLTRQRDFSALMSSLGVREAPGDVMLRSGSEIYLQRAVPVVVNADGRMLSWHTRAETVRGLLNELAIDVSSYDIIRLNGAEVALNDGVVQAPLTGEALVSQASSGPAVLEIRRAVPLTIYEDGRPMTLKSARPNLELALQDAGVRLGPADIVDPPISAPIVAGMGVTVKHARAVTLLLGKEEHTIYTQRPLLKEALADIGMTLASDDRIEPGLDTLVTEGMTAKLVRVGGREFTEKETVTKKTEFKPDANLSGNSYRVVQGHDGVRTRSYRIVIEDGIEKEKKLIKEGFEREPQPTVIYYPAGSAAPTGLPDGNINVTGVNRVYATWYNAASSGKAANDPGYGITASGKVLVKGIVAVDPKVIPMGTRLYVPGYGFAVAGDTGGGIKGNMIDLGYPDGAPADWRTGWVDIYILGRD